MIFPKKVEGNKVNLFYLPATVDRVKLCGVDGCHSIRQAVLDNAVITLACMSHHVARRSA